MMRFVVLAAVSMTTLTGTLRAGLVNLSEAGRTRAIVVRQFGGAERASALPLPLTPSPKSFAVKCNEIAEQFARTIRGRGDTNEAAPFQLVVQQFEVSEEQFDSWMFQSSGNEAGCRKRLEASLSTELADLARRFELTESQQQKLRLAAQGDIKQFFDRVEQARDFFRKNRTDQQAVNAVFQEIQPLQQQLTNDFFGGESFFRKVLLTTLDETQSEKLQVQEQEERIARHHQLVQATVLQAETHVPMVTKQRSAFVELLINHSRPPAKKSNYDSYVVMYYASEIPDEALAEIFDEPQQVALRQFAQRGQQLKPFLEQQGLLMEEDKDE